jgi:hypothetical protein
MMEKDLVKKPSVFRLELIILLSIFLNYLEFLAILDQQLKRIFHFYAYII